MKIRIFLFLIFFGICNAQELIHKASLIPSKDSVSPDEEFSITYKLWNLASYGHETVYLGLKDGYFEAIGSDRWEKEIIEGDTIVVTFSVKLKNYVKNLENEKLPLSVGYSFKPFGDRITHGEFKRININIVNTEESLPKTKRNNETDSEEIEINFNTIQLGSPFQKIMNITPQTDLPIMEYPSVIPNNINRISEPNLKSFGSNNLILKTLFKTNKKLTINNLPGPITIIFTASTFSFRNPTNQQLPWQYFTVEIYGLQNPTDPNPVMIEQEFINSSSTGGFTISTTQNYPYYVLVLWLESSFYVALEPPDNWNGGSGNHTIYGIATEPIQRPNQSTQYNVPDPDFGASGATELSKMLNICMDMVADGYEFIRNNTSDIPGKSLIFFNEQNTVITTSFANQYTSGTITYPGLHITDDDWDHTAIVLHEYGHCIQFLFADRPTEAGGRHYLGIRYNPHLAYSEGWRISLLRLLVQTLQLIIDSIFQPIHPIHY